MEMKKLSNNDCEIVELPMEKPIPEQKDLTPKELRIILKRIEHQFESIRNGSKTVQIIDKSMKKVIVLKMVQNKLVQTLR
jgi:hypothetical protein